MKLRFIEKHTRWELTPITIIYDRDGKIDRIEFYSPSFGAYSLGPEDVLISRFTGVEDKEGKPIYEHDIVQVRRANSSLHGEYVVVWSDTYSAFVYRYEDSERIVKTSAGLPYLIRQPNLHRLGVTKEFLRGNN